MFQIRVHAPTDVAAAAEEAKDSGCDSDVSLTDVADEEEKQAPDAALFLTGNPLVRVTRGKLRFFRPDSTLPTENVSKDANADHQSIASRTAGTGANGSHQQLPRERNTLLCIVTVPSHMAPVELLEFLAGFRADVASVRVLQDPDRSNCMALLQFARQERADQFFLVRLRTVVDRSGYCWYV